MSSYIGWLARRYGMRSEWYDSLVGSFPAAHNLSNIARISALAYLLSKLPPTNGVMSIMSSRKEQDP